MHFVTGSTAKDYRIDLPATGQYSIRLALGDATSNQTGLKCELLDNTTVFATPVNNGNLLPAGDYIDATGVIRTSEADWTANNAAVLRTFTSTIFIIRVGGFGASNITPFAAVYIESTGASRIMFRGA
jgi:hypothetical protein